MWHLCISSFPEAAWKLPGNLALLAIQLPAAGRCPVTCKATTHLCLHGGRIPCDCARQGNEALSLGIKGGEECNETVVGTSVEGVKKMGGNEALRLRKGQRSVENAVETYLEFLRRCSGGHNGNDGGNGAGTFDRE